MPCVISDPHQGDLGSCGHSTRNVRYPASGGKATFSFDRGGFGWCVMKGRDRWAFFKDSFPPRFWFVPIRSYSCLFTFFCFTVLSDYSTRGLYAILRRSLGLCRIHSIGSLCCTLLPDILSPPHTCICIHTRTHTCTRAYTHIPTPNFLNAHQTNPLHPKRSLSSPRSLLPSLMTSIPGIAFISFRYSDPGEENLLFWSVCVLASVVRSLRRLH